MKALLIIAVTALMLIGRAPAQTLDDANQAFAAGKYHDSTQAYEALLAKNGYSAPLLFDLGNSQYREGNLAQAILAYKRAQWLAPNDPDIAANLQAAQRQAGLAVAEPRWSDKFTHILSASQWAWLGCAAWTIFCASLLARAFLPRQGNLFASVAIAACFILTFAIAGAVFASDPMKQAVVTDKNATALISPFPAAQTVFSPAPGETVTLVEVYGDYLRVTDHAGHTGWISKTQLAHVIPPAVPHSSGAGQS